MKRRRSKPIDWRAAVALLAGKADDEAIDSQREQGGDDGQGQGGPSPPGTKRYFPADRRTAMR